jgi:SAM-dependent methyltransferase
MRAIPSILRRAEHEALASLTLSGSVLDLGGERGAEYLTHIQGVFSVTAVNIDSSAQPDIVLDLEQPLSMIEDASFDHVLLINVLEHIFDYRQLLAEATRILRPGGSVIIVVPFLFPIHPSPNDYWRFSNQTLEKECIRAGLSIKTLTPLGAGVFSARHLFIARLMPGPVRLVMHYTFRYLALALDALFVHVARLLRKRYAPAEYALGYAVVATKS